MENNQLDIQFFDDTHTYLVNGKQAKISVTALIEKQITKTDWRGVDMEMLQRAANRGTDVHSDLEHFVGYGTEPRTEECKNFAKFLKDNNWVIEDPLCEFKLAITFRVPYKGSYAELLLTGTADLICKLNGKYTVIDHKTTSVVHKEYVAWQMSLLNYMARKCNGMVINGRPFNYHEAEQLFVFHFDKQAKFKPVPAEFIPDSEIERLLEAEAKDEEYHATTIDILTPRQQLDLEEIEKKLCSLKAAQKMLDEQEKLLKAEMKTAFESHPQVKKVEMSNVTVSYTSPTTKTVFDTEAFQRDYPELYAKYSVTQPVAGSVRITLAKNVKDMLEAKSSELPLLPTLPRPKRAGTKKGFFK